MVLSMGVLRGGARDVNLDKAHSNNTPKITWLSHLGYENDSCVTCPIQITQKDSGTKTVLLYGSLVYWSYRSFDNLLASWIKKQNNISVLLGWHHSPMSDYNKSYINYAEDKEYSVAMLIDSRETLKRGTQCKFKHNKQSFTLKVDRITQKVETKDVPSDIQANVNKVVEWMNSFQYHVYDYTQGIFQETILPVFKRDHKACIHILFRPTGSDGPEGHIVLKQKPDNKIEYVIYSNPGNDNLAEIRDEIEAARYTVEQYVYKE